jgi:hypothetical protein
MKILVGNSKKQEKIKVKSKDKEKPAFFKAKTGKNLFSFLIKGKDT